MDKALKPLALLTGAACVLIGIAHFFLGARIVAGGGDFTPSIDSQEHFYGVIFAGYGLAYIRAARQDPIQAPLIRFLATLMMVGGIGRIISWIDQGKPHAMWIGLGAVEFVVPALFFWLLAIHAASSPEAQANSQA